MEKKIIGNIKILKFDTKCIYIFLDKNMYITLDFKKNKEIIVYDKGKTVNIHKNSIDVLNDIDDKILSKEFVYNGIINITGNNSKITFDLKNGTVFSFSVSILKDFLNYLKY